MVHRQRTSSDGLRVVSPSKSKRLSSSLRCALTCVIISVFLTASALLAFRTSGEVIMGAWRQHAFSPKQSRRAMLEACIADTDARRVLVTGQAGFIGMHTARQLHSQGDIVIGLDNFNDYYPVSLKRARADVLAELGIMTVEGDLNDQQLLNELFEACNFTHVVHLAAQAGVRYAAKKPMSYVDSNVAGTVSLLEAVKKQPVMPAVVYASSSSVYGRNEKVPFSEEDRVDRPASLYAATKRADELIAHVYHNIAGMSLTGLRFFTVYGPWGRPDMAAYSFARNICFGREIRMFQGPGGMELSRDFTYIDDIVAGIVGAVDTAAPDANGEPQYRIFNLGNTHPETLSSFVDKLQAALGRDPVRRVVPLPALGDVLQTRANVTAARLAFGYEPRTSLDLGLRLFAEWFFTYYGPNGTDLRPDELQYVPL